MAQDFIQVGVFLDDADMARLAPGLQPEGRTWLRDITLGQMRQLSVYARELVPLNYSERQALLQANLFMDRMGLYKESLGAGRVRSYMASTAGPGSILAIAGELPIQMVLGMALPIGLALAGAGIGFIAGQQTK